MKKLTAIMLAGLLGCATGQKADNGHFPTIELTNNGLEPITFRTSVERLANVYPKESECVYIRNPETRTKIYFESESKYYSTLGFVPMRQRGWKLNIGTTPRLDILTLQPAKRCKN